MTRRGDLISRLASLHWFLLLTVLVLATMGVAVLFSAGWSPFDPTTNGARINADLAINHGVRFLLFLMIALAAALVPLRIWASLAFPAYFIGVILLIGVDLFGVVVKGERWLQLGPIRIQPSELMKLAVPLALARYYHQMWEARRRGFWIHVWALAIVMIPTVLVLRQPDLGTALMILGTGCAVIFFAGINLYVVAGVIALLIASAPLVYFFGLHDYQRERVNTMFNPEADPLGTGYQLQQALIAIGSGGAGGKGYMEGSQKQLDYIPEQHTDFIFTIIAEEFGFAGSMTVLVIWALVLVQGLSIASRSASRFGALAAAGFTSTLFLYVGINIGMVIGLLPVVGIPLPLISYGGTVMMTVMIGFGLLMAIHIDRDEQMALRGIL
ncbi:MAG: rod shape-determining protein RodA [Hyphomonadaceae bacterium]